MKRYILMLLVVAVCGHLRAQFQESALALTDKNCYVSGERMWVSVCVQPAGLSRVAYVELADTRGMVTQAMVQLTAGRGWAKLPLPQDMHSGNYQLSVYTRNMRGLGAQTFGTTLVGVINAQRQNELDHITYLPVDEKAGEAPAPRRRYKVGETAHIAIPQDSALIIRTLSVLRTPLSIVAYEAPKYEGAAETHAWTPELEGHIVVARPTGGQVASSCLSAVGKSIELFDGQRQADGTWHYYTTGLTGHLPLMVHGYDAQGNLQNIQLESPYAQVLPQKLPALEVKCQRQELQQRSIGAQQEQALTEWEQVDTLPHQRNLLSRSPHTFYDMEEYTQFRTVREALLEFIQGISRRMVDGRPYLYVPQADTRALSDLPAMVLLDGMPVSNIDDILDYDARLLKYVQVYTGCYTFGSTYCRGVIAFHTRKGLLSNYSLDEASQLVRYQFPQQRPVFLTPLQPETGTVLWLPQVDDVQASFTVPTLPGIYQIVLKGTDNKGEPFQSVEEFEVL